MTLQSTYPRTWPGMADSITATPGTSGTITIDAAGEYLAFIFQAREAMNISHVGFVPSASTSGVAEIRVETVSSGLPSGTLWNSGTTNNSNRTTGTLAANTMDVGALTGATGTINLGDLVAIKLLYSSGTSFNPADLGSWRTSSTRPYLVNNIGTPTAAALASPLALVVGSDANTFYYVPGLIPDKAVTGNSFANTGGAREGVRFQVPFKCRLVGLRAYLNGQTGAFNYGIWDDAGTEVSSSSTAFDGSAWAGGTNGPTELLFDSQPTLSPGTWYRAALEPSSVTNTGLPYLTVGSTNYRAACPGGTNFYRTTYTTVGGWVDTNTTHIPFMDIIVDQLADDVGSGGGFKMIGTGGGLIG